jgi:AcrR family transcriptional regulator
MTGRTSPPLRKPLGRRPGETDTRETILNVAEEEFAARGYASTALREIAERAQVNQALVRYYFGSKEALFHAIFLRGAQKINSARLQLLDELEQRPEPATVEDIIRAFLLPAIDMRRKGAVGANFMRLQARLQNEPGAVAQKLRQSVYEESTRRYIAALQRVLPDLEPTALYWRYVFMVGAYLYTISDTNQLEVWTHGAASSRNVDESLRHLVPFFVGGMTAPLV